MMCKTIRHFGVELEGYTSTNLRDESIKGWKGVQDGSLHDSGEWCNECDGDGYYYTTCDDCYRGSIDCNDCGCHGETECYKCDGSGWENEEESLECGYCDGTGRLMCEECEGRGRVECPTCNGNYDDIRIDCECCDGTGSVGDGEYGVEFVSPILQETDSIREVLDELGRHNWKVDDTCGTHIHVDGRDLTTEDIVKLVLLNVAIEPIIYTLVDEQRINKPYSQKFNNSWYNSMIPLSNATQSQLTTIMYGGIRNRFDKYEPQRYYGLNLHSWFLRKTIEFRYFEGQIDASRVEKFVEFVTKIVEFAKTATYAQCLILAHRFRNNNDLCSSIDEIKEILGLTFDPKTMVISPNNFDDCKDKQDVRVLIQLASA